MPETWEAQSPLGGHFKMAITCRSKNVLVPCYGTACSPVGSLALEARIIAVSCTSRRGGSSFGPRNPKQNWRFFVFPILNLFLQRDDSYCNIQYILTLVLTRQYFVFCIKYYLHCSTILHLDALSHEEIQSGELLPAEPTRCISLDLAERGMRPQPALKESVT
ncbi:hypothetical protein VTO42DRAFT_5327 [Malbranchea cinnamomea]